ncbi:Arm DNA-binding domain-containing protein [Francisella salina]|uniref:Site-specific recombinase, phage integrase family n=1 Tax=Francisella salina TaxID=573569 RepID=A0ABM5M9B8_FRAST|nr:Arm DNA-binding domain-containing protein [Francisella salina]AEI35814.1 site-specific recombinase, phage integrase family [Francisella salina]
MAKKITELTLKALKYKDQKSKSLGNKLYIRIDKNNSKYFFYNYMIAGNRYSIGIGGYPAVSLANARVIASKYSELLANGENPKDYVEGLKANDDKLFSNIIDKYIQHKIKIMIGQRLHRKNTLIDSIIKSSRYLKIDI